MSKKLNTAPCGTVRVLTLVSLISATFGVSAQTAPHPDEKVLTPVVVTAFRAEQQQAEALPHTTVLTAEEIRNSQSVDLPSLLRREAGIQITQNGGVGGATGFFVRGAETRQTLVLIDGVPMTKQDATGAVNIQDIMLTNVDRIEIVRGNVSAIYGSGALGGVVQIFTKKGRGPAQFNASAEAGSRNTNRMAAGFSGSANGFNYAVSASRFKTDGFSAQNPQQIPTGNPDRDGYENESVSGNFGYQIASGHELGFRFLHADSDLEYDGFGAANVDTSRTKTETYTAYSKNKWADFWDSEISFSQFSDKNDYLTNGARTSSANTKTDQVLWNNNFAVGENWTVTAGVESRDESIDTGILNRTRDVWAGFAGLAGQLENHSFQVNLRYDDYEDVGSADTAYVGYGYDFLPGYKAIASYSTSFAAPPLGYLYSTGFGNPSLKPEEIHTREIGMQYASGDHLLRLVAFESQIDNQIQYDLVTYRFENVQKVKNEGIELSYSGNMAGTELRSSLTVQDPIDESTGQTLNRRAKKMASVGLSRAFGPVMLGTDWQYTGTRRDGARTLSSYVEGDLTARYAITKQIALFGRIENVTDEEYQTAYGYNQAPRSYFVGVSWQQ